MRRLPLVSKHGDRMSDHRHEERNHTRRRHNPILPRIAVRAAPALTRAGGCWDATSGRSRAFGVEVTDGVLWFWIGTHADYDHVIG